MLPVLVSFKFDLEPRISIVPTEMSPIESRVIAPSASALIAPVELK